jgi:hypothetical protein
MSTMPFEDLESAYEALALAIDTAGLQREALFLTRLVLLLGHEVGDITRFRHAIEAALAGLEQSDLGVTAHPVLQSAEVAPSKTR